MLVNILIGLHYPSLKISPIFITLFFLFYETYHRKYLSNFLYIHIYECNSGNTILSFVRVKKKYKHSITSKGSALKMLPTVFKSM